MVTSIFLIFASAIFRIGQMLFFTVLDNFELQCMLMGCSHIMQGLCSLVTTGRNSMKDMVSDISRLFQHFCGASLLSQIKYTAHSVLTVTYKGADLFFIS